MLLQPGNLGCKPISDIAQALLRNVLDGLKAANSDEGNAAVEQAVKEKVMALTDRFPMYGYQG